MGGGALYRALAPSGPNQSSGAKNPGTDDGTYWMILPSEYFEHYFINDDIEHICCLPTHKTVFFGGPYCHLGTLGKTTPSTTQYSTLIKEYDIDADPKNLNNDEYIADVYINHEYNGSRGLAIRCVNEARTGSTSLYLWNNSGTSGERLCIINGTVFRPWTNNITSLGTASYKWTTVYATTSTINTSDRRMKSDIDSIPDEILDCWGNVNFCQFKMNDSVEKKGLAARLHTGLIAQDIESAFLESSLDPRKYGFFCHDVWDSSPDYFDPDGNISIPASSAGDQYSLRYEEALCMEAAYQRRENRRLKDRVSELENKVLQLEEKLNQLLNN